MSGKPITSKPVYGYLMDEDENFIIDEEAAPVVKQIYNLCPVSYTHLLLSALALSLILQAWQPRHRKAAIPPKRAVIPTMRLSPFLKMDSADQVMLLPGGR